MIGKTDDGTQQESDQSVNEEGFNVHHLSEHDFNLDSISVNAIKVVHRLKSQGFQAYLVGGCVRDLLLSHHPKDFDVATNAKPEEVRKLFRNSSLIGRRFRLAHIRFGREIIEVATFRGSGNNRDNPHKASHQVHENGRILRDNVYGSMGEDALRRDFTVNALYLDPEQEEVLDRVGGMHDHKNKLIRLIGNPEDRYREDPVRLLRAIRFSAKLDFQIEPETLQPIADMGSLLQGVPQARLYEELLKLFLTGHALKTFESLCQFDLLKHLFPQTSQLLEQSDQDALRHLITLALQSTDNRIQANKPVTAYFLFSALLWGAIQSELSRQTKTDNQYMDMQAAMNTVLRDQGKTIALPKRATIPMREVWSLQPRFYQRRGAKPHRLLEHPRFRAAYDFILIRSETGAVESELAEWWTRFQTVSPSQRRKMSQTNRRRSRNRKNADAPRSNAAQKTGDA